MDFAAVQVVTAAAVTMFGAWLAYRSKGHESRIKALEKETEECLKDRSAYREALDQHWPSDTDKTQEMISSAHAAMKAAGLVLTVEHVADAIRKIKDSGGMS